MPNIKVNPGAGWGAHVYTYFIRLLGGLSEIMKFIVHIKHLEKRLLTEYYESLINIYKPRYKLKQYVEKEGWQKKKKMRLGQEREWREKKSKDMFFYCGGIDILDSQKKRIP